MSQAALELTFEEMFDVEVEAERSGTGVFENPQGDWGRLLAQGPLHAGTMTECMGLPAGVQTHYVPGRTYFSVFSFVGVSDVFTRKDDFNSEFYHDLGLVDWLGDNIISMDGLRHRRYRDVVQEHFQPNAASTWWRDQVITGLVNELVDGFDPSASIDLNSRLCARLPMRTVTTAFGLTPEEGFEFRGHMQVANGFYESAERKAQAQHAALAILDQVIRQRQAEPRDDVISRLATAELTEDDGATRRLTVEEISAFCRLIVFAGGGTTWRQLATTLFCLLNHRDQMEAAMADRSLIPNVILEAARWGPVVPLFQRRATRDTTLLGTDIPKDAVIYLCLSSANRDPSRWDNPDAFDISRPLQRSVAFAAGVHSCLGQHVAREELGGAINALFDRFPNMRWDPAHPTPKISGGLLQRGPGPMHVLLN